MPLCPATRVYYVEPARSVNWIKLTITSVHAGPGNERAPGFRELHFFRGLGGMFFYFSSEGRLNVLLLFFTLTLAFEIVCITLVNIFVNFTVKENIGKGQTILLSGGIGCGGPVRLGFCTGGIACCAPVRLGLCTCEVLVVHRRKLRVVHQSKFWLCTGGREDCLNHLVLAGLECLLTI